MQVYANVNSGELYFVTKELDGKIELTPIKCSLNTLQISKDELNTQYKTIEEYKKK